MQNFLEMLSHLVKIKMCQLIAQFTQNSLMVADYIIVHT